MAAAILALLAFLAGLIGYLVGDHDYTDPGRGAIPGVLNQNDPGNGLGADLLYVAGTWVFDSLHEGWNELHPIKKCTPIGTWTGVWPADIPAKAKKLDDGFGDARDPVTVDRQGDLHWQWAVHPYVDGCGDFSGLTPLAGGAPHIG